MYIQYICILVKVWVCILACMGICALVALNRNLDSGERKVAVYHAPSVYVALFNITEFQHFTFIDTCCAKIIEFDTQYNKTMQYRLQTFWVTLTLFTF